MDSLIQAPVLLGVKLGSPKQQVVLGPGDWQDFGFGIEEPEDLRVVPIWDELESGQID